MTSDSIDDKCSLPELQNLSSEPSPNRCDPVTAERVRQMLRKTNSCLRNDSNVMGIRGPHIPEWLVYEFPCSRHPY